MEPLPSASAPQSVSIRGDETSSNFDEFSDIFSSITSESSALFEEYHENLSSIQSQEQKIFQQEVSQVQETSQQETAQVQETSQQETAQVQETSQQETAQVQETSQQETAQVQETSQQETAQVQETSQQETTQVQETSKEETSGVLKTKEKEHQAKNVEVVTETKFSGNKEEIEQGLMEFVGVKPGGIFLVKRINCDEDATFGALKKQAEADFAQSQDKDKVKIQDAMVQPLASKMIKFGANQAAIHQDILKNYPHINLDEAIAVCIDDLPPGMNLEKLDKKDLSQIPGLKLIPLRAMTDDEQNSISKLLTKHLKYHIQINVVQFQVKQKIDSQQKIEEKSETTHKQLTAYPSSYKNPYTENVGLRFNLKCFSIYNFVVLISRLGEQIEKENAKQKDESKRAEKESIEKDEKKLTEKLKRNLNQDIEYYLKEDDIKEFDVAAGRIEEMEKKYGQLLSDIKDSLIYPVENWHFDEEKQKEIIKIINENGGLEELAKLQSIIVHLSEISKMRNEVSFKFYQVIANRLGIIMKVLGRS